MTEQAKPLKDAAVRRAAIANQARVLARSGLHSGYDSVVEALGNGAEIEAAARLMADPLFRLQLDRLCYMAREKRVRRMQPPARKHAKTRANTLRYSPVGLASL